MVLEVIDPIATLALCDGARLCLGQQPLETMGCTVLAKHSICLCIEKFYGLEHMNRYLFRVFADQELEF